MYIWHDVFHMVTQRIECHIITRHYIPPCRWDPCRRRCRGRVCRVDDGGPAPALPLADVEVDLGVEVDEQAHRDHAQHEQLQSKKKERREPKVTPYRTEVVPSAQKRFKNRLILTIFG